MPWKILIACPDDGVKCYPGYDERHLKSRRVSRSMRWGVTILLLTRLTMKGDAPSAKITINPQTFRSQKAQIRIAVNTTSWQISHRCRKNRYFAEYWRASERFWSRMHAFTRRITPMQLHTRKVVRIYMPWFWLARYIRRTSDKNTVSIVINELWNLTYGVIWSG